CGTRVGSPAAVKSPRTGSAMIWAACLPTAQPSVSATPRPSDGSAGWLAAAAADPADPLPLPVADDGRLRDQSGLTAAAAGPVSGGPVAACSGMTTSRRWFAG